MIKLPERKYEPKHNDELKYYAQGWNTAIESVEYWSNKHGIEYTKKCLLNNKKYYLKRKETPYFNGAYDCIVEIEKLNEKAEAEHRLDNFFQDSLEALDKLNIRSEQKKAVLVVDDPKNCGECALSRIHYDDEHEELYYTCAFTEQQIASDEGEKCKHKDCPLRSLSSSLDWSTINQCTDTESFEYGRCCGRQELLDEILEKEC